MDAIPFMRHQTNIWCHYVNNLTFKEKKVDSTEQMQNNGSARFFQEIKLQLFSVLSLLCHTCV